MDKAYTKPFAEYYDIRTESLIQNVDQEIEFLEYVFQEFSGIQVKKILDAGCGTGRHTIKLAQIGYSTAGLDQSINMLKVLEEKVEDSEYDIHTVNKDMRDIDFDCEFHAVISMNSAFQYLLTDEEILNTLKAFHIALETGGVLVLDLMNFLSLLGRYKENVVEEYTKNCISFERAIRHYIDNVKAIWTHKEFGIIRDNDKEIYYHETHKFRMINYNEMYKLISEAGFSNIKCYGEFISQEEAKNSAKRLIFVAVK
ncbi:methyltransferase domain-containing protein [Candidatus Poribacteria bacterium]|nr:methyltransferase domain-containing protein [Candidatus Poribacteria bacterium]